MADQTQQQQHEVWVPIPAAYNPGECRISKPVTGPSGGKSWQRLTRGVPATGGELQMWLTPGVYKRTYWSNGRATKDEFTVYKDGSWSWTW